MFYECLNGNDRSKCRPGPPRPSRYTRLPCPVGRELRTLVSVRTGLLPYVDYLPKTPVYRKLYLCTEFIFTSETNRASESQAVNKNDEVFEFFDLFHDPVVVSAPSYIRGGFHPDVLKQRTYEAFLTG